PEKNSFSAGLRNFSPPHSALVRQDCIVQGRWVSAQQLGEIAELIAGHPQWSRWRLSRALCQQWDWRNDSGQLKDMAARALLLKRQQKGLVQLPARRRLPTNRMNGHWIAARCWDQSPRQCALNQLGPLFVQEVSSERAGRQQVAAALAQFHYLGYGKTIE